jgi:hypothetical protein
MTGETGKSALMMNSDSDDSGRGQPLHFYGAAIIDASGREVPITEEMIRRACEALAESWRIPASGRGLSKANLEHR